ncbi:MAG: hypothetical protein BGO39_12725 [Chloroflexi bacterium 54-19]|nr:MAG: hypothetical protein BGO39_12725 [Chloroflexi bacterium 54-19]
MDPWSSTQFMPEEKAEEQARLILSLIEQRTRQVISLSHFVLEVLFKYNPKSGPAKPLTEHSGYVGLDFEVPLTLQDLNDYVAHWQSLLEYLTPYARAALLNLLTTKYGYVPLPGGPLAGALRLEDPAVAQAFAHRYGQTLATYLAAREVLSPLEKGPDLARALKDEITLVNLPRGEYLMREGDPGDGMYIIVSGRLRPFITGEDGTERFLADKGRGEIIGEMALITGESRTASLYALRDSVLVKVSTEAFGRLTAQYPQIAMSLAGQLVETLRLEGRRKNVPALPNTIALVPANPGCPMKEFVANLVEALAVYGPTLHLNSATFETLFGSRIRQALARENESELEVTWLNEQDSKYRFVLYETDPSLTPWTERCLRQADRILLVGTAGSSGKPGRIEKVLERPDFQWTDQRQELIIIHPDRYVRPSNTGVWLAQRKVERHYHVCLTYPQDFQRLARSLSGNTIGLVLGGGGARGFAHLGLIRALEELKIPVDMVGGASAGSIAAAHLAMGLDWKAMRDNIKFLFSVFDDYTLPLVSLVSGGKFQGALKSMFGDIQIEDLWLDFFCVSTNLSRAELKIHRAGRLERAVQASASIPGVFPPVLDNGDLLVDGAVLDNIPIDVMQTLAEDGKFIVSDVGAEGPPLRQYSYKSDQSGWLVLWDRLLPFHRRRYVTPSIISLMTRSTTLTSATTRNQIRQAATLYLSHPVEAFGPLATRDADKLVEIGYRYALQQLENCPVDFTR